MHLTISLFIDWASYHYIQFKFIVSNEQQKVFVFVKFQLGGQQSQGLTKTHQFLHRKTKQH